MFAPFCCFALSKMDVFETAWRWQWEISCLHVWMGWSAYGSDISVEELSITVREELEQVHEDHRIPVTVLRATSVMIHGICYEAGSILLWRNSDLDGPELSIINYIYVANNIQYFECSSISIEKFNPIINSFICEKGNWINSFALAAFKLKYKWPLIRHTIEGKLYIMLWNVDFCWC